MSFRQKIASMLTAMLLIWAVCLPTWILKAQAAQLTLQKDTLTNSVISAQSKHTITYTQTTVTTAGNTVTITFAAGFSLSGVSATTDVTLNTPSAQTLAASPSGATWGSAISGQVLTLTSGTGTIAAGAAVTIVVGVTNKPTNPSSTGSYAITIGGTQPDTGATMVAITNSVAVTAAVSTSLTFTVSGISSGAAAVNGDTDNGGLTSVTTTATTIPWGTLTAGTKYLAGQSLAVTTNAANGFVVTIQDNQPMTSSTGATISRFSNGASGGLGTSTPIAWTAPTGTLGTTATYGHMGITTDSGINSNEFNTAYYAGNTSTPRNIFSYTGPADGTTAQKGAAKVGFKIQITALQAAANDYTNTFTYVCTPSF